MVEIQNHIRIDEDDLKLDDEDIAEKKSTGERLWQDMPSAEMAREKASLKLLLEKYDISAETDTSDLRDELRKNIKKPSELKKFKDMLSRKADKEWLRLAKNYGGFDAPGKLGEMLNKEMKTLHSDFTGLKLKEGETNKFSVLTNMKGMLEAKAKFVERYKKQTPFVINLFEQSMNELQFKSSKEKHLNDVLEIVGGLEDSPEAIQHEFKKRAENIHKIDGLKVLKANLIKEYASMTDEYEEKLDEAKEYFGGGTAKEFSNWFHKEDSFAKMKFALRLLPKYISDRKEEYEKINVLLDQLDEKDAERFRGIIGKMGLSEKREYRKNTLESAVKNKSLLVAKYEGELLTARHERIPLYEKDEKDNLLARFKKFDPKTQKHLLIAEVINIESRKQVIRDYLLLPDKVKDLALFFKSNAIEREKLLNEAIERRIKLEEKSEFTGIEFDEDEDVSDENLHELVHYLHSSKSQKLKEKALEKEMTDIEKQNIATVIDLVKWKKEKAIDAERKNQTQQEIFIEDYENWKIGLRIDDTEKDADLESDELKANKIREAQMVKSLYEEGIVVHTDSKLKNRQNLNRDDLMNARGDKITKAMRESQYDPDLYIAENDGREPVNLASVLSEAMEKMALEMARKMTDGVLDQLGLTGSNRHVAKNTLQSANNTEHFVKDFWKEEIGQDAQTLRSKKLKNVA